MTKFLYDSEFPYVVVWGEYGGARFSRRDNANNYAEQSVGHVIDTTPKVFKKGFYQYANSGVFYYDGEGDWTDVVAGYSSVSNSYVEALDLKRLVVAEDD